MMRTLQQCKAEVFRRSEEKIRKRKIVRRCVIAACLPLCLFVGMWSVLILPAMMPAKSADNSIELAPPMEMVQDSEKFTESTTNGVSKPVLATITVNGEEYALSGEDAQTAIELLRNLSYNPAKVCKCLPQFRIKTQTESYGVHLSEGYARCEGGQADLTQEQVEILREIYQQAVPEK